MEEVVVDVRQHPGARAEVVERALDALGIGPVLRRRDGGVGRRDLEQDRRLFVRDRGLRDELVREGVSPRKVDLDLGEAELEQLELAKVLVEQVAGWWGVIVGQLGRCWERGLRYRSCRSLRLSRRPGGIAGGRCTRRRSYLGFRRRTGR